MEATDDALRREAKSLLNRLRSIKHDAEFVSQIAARFPSLKLVANERCGLWYIPPSKRAHGHTVYFKSTDGHFGTWNLSLKRLNLHILPVIVQDSGCIIVDSTRSGKRFPDSLSKTIPIWCSVLNTAVAEYRKQTSNENTASDFATWDTDFHSLSSVISPSEHNQIQSKIQSLAASVLATPSIDMEYLSTLLKKPLRPIWIAPDTHYFSNIIEPNNSGYVKKAWTDSTDFEFYPVICVNASEVAHDASQRRNGFYYVQGAADDHEMWAPAGLTPETFWRHEGKLLEAGLSDIDCARIAKDLLARERWDVDCSMQSQEALFHWIGETGIAIGGRRAGRPPECLTNFDVIINCGAVEYDDIANISEQMGKRYLYLAIPEGKKGQHMLFESIPIATQFLLESTQRFVSPRVLVHCAQGRDRSVAISLSLMLQFLNNEQKMEYNQRRPRDSFTKKTIQDLLIYIQQYRHIALPSRAFMCRINDYFLSSSRL
ncbi:initiator tRNA phosphoribosyl transferase [Rhizoclosmatium globosum]|uniref:Initiator tRNA phosphoribosyl transferase n=1 Tax=Rhizoclosmatium globosum TaxID=329046 RepID=A0A1Y2CV67_9FUNG|nr:initiator tRNA phosphoribosyl transferase [Rhizoclosmatium globosum]|eukprot:ORY50941.1 initiator tRNA phosphoribosyl transferase [Rhizoclosmatium globosum]